MIATPLKFLKSLPLMFLSALALADAATAPVTLESLQERLRSGELAASPLFYSDEERLVAFANMAQVAPTRAIPAGDAVLELPSAPLDLSGATYTVGDSSYTLADYLAQPSLLGIAVVKDGALVFEHYADTHGPDTRWVSFSVTKSVTAMLIGAAIEDGFIDSVDDTVEMYVPRLRGTPYGAVPLRAVLHMASGVAWNENYEDPESDVSLAGDANGVRLTDYLAKLPKAHEPGAVFNYNTGEANLAGEILRAAIANNAATYITHKVWQPFGMEHSANWLTDGPGGGEAGGCCISATTRDYARLGLFALADGVLADGTRVLPEGWMAASVTASPAADQYGYFWWLNGDGSYQAGGIFGQRIFIDPESKVVIAIQSNAPKATDSTYHEHMDAVTGAIRDVLKQR